jgi:tetratricopeptide (TPR) repeat protein
MISRITLVCAALLLSACAGQRPSRASVANTNAPRSAEALFQHGRELAARGDASRAQQYLELAIHAGYPESRAIVPLVQVCIAAWRLRAALGYAHAYLERNPQAFRLRYLVASIHSALGQADLAVRELRRVLAQHPDAAQAHYLLGVIERDAFHDDGAASQSFNAYVERDPDGTFSAEVRAWLLEHPRPATSARLDAGGSRPHNQGQP